MTRGVASAHGSHESSSISHRFTHACCIPSARMTTTFCVASKSPSPHQIAAIQYHCVGCAAICFAFMLGILRRHPAPAAGYAGNRPLPAASGMCAACAAVHTLVMRTQLLFVLVGAALVGSLAAGAEAPTTSAAPAYTADGQLRAPGDYRQWIYLTTGFDM